MADISTPSKHRLNQSYLLLSSTLEQPRLMLTCLFLLIFTLDCCPPGELSLCCAEFARFPFLLPLRLPLSANRPHSLPKIWLSRSTDRLQVMLRVRTTFRRALPAWRCCQSATRPIPGRPSRAMAILSSWCSRLSIPGSMAASPYRAALRVTTIWSSNIPATSHQRRSSPVMTLHTLRWICRNSSPVCCLLLRLIRITLAQLIFSCGEALQSAVPFVTMTAVRRQVFTYAFSARTAPANGVGLGFKVQWPPMIRGAIASSVCLRASMFLKRSSKSPSISPLTCSTAPQVPEAVPLAPPPNSE